MKPYVVSSSPFSALSIILNAQTFAYLLKKIYALHIVKCKRLRNYIVMIFKKQYLDPRNLLLLSIFLRVGDIYV